MFASPVGIIRRVWQPVESVTFASVAKTEHAVVWPPHVKRYFCAHLPAPSARGVIRGEQQQQQESKSVAITIFLHVCLLGPASVQWNHWWGTTGHMQWKMWPTLQRLLLLGHVLAHILWPAPRLRGKKEKMFKLNVWFTSVNIPCYVFRYTGFCHLCRKTKQLSNCQIE